MDNLPLNKRSVSFASVMVDNLGNAISDAKQLVEAKKNRNYKLDADNKSLKSGLPIISRVPFTKTQLLPT